MTPYRSIESETPIRTKFQLELYPLTKENKTSDWNHLNVLHPFTAIDWIGFDSKESFQFRSLQTGNQTNAETKNNKNFQFSPFCCCFPSFACPLARSDTKFTFLLLHWMELDWMRWSYSLLSSCFSSIASVFCFEIFSAGQNEKTFIVYEMENILYFCYSSR